MHGDNMGFSLNQSWKCFSELLTSIAQIIGAFLYEIILQFYLFTSDLCSFLATHLKLSAYVIFRATDTTNLISFWYLDFSNVDEYLLLVIEQCKSRQ